ncbi:unnamed protein product [Nippostrongylus brasiliensis]|uniref:Lipoprotein n=1 Tax=Nippostrongylus brasiliensis TaxID=27835 RepID=A0A0N4XCL8_NIPBR|nr:unnamed protein product [Nippostrongylus brasiliensis]
MMDLTHFLLSLAAVISMAAACQSTPAYVYVNDEKFKLENATICEGEVMKTVKNIYTKCAAFNLIAERQNQTFDCEVLGKVTGERTDDYAVCYKQTGEFRKKDDDMDIDNVANQVKEQIDERRKKLD